MAHQDVRAFECKHSSLTRIESVHTESHSATDMPGKSHKYRERSLGTPCDSFSKVSAFGTEVF